MSAIRRTLPAFTCLAAILAIAAGPARGAGSVGVNFVGRSNYTSPMGSAELAGAEPHAWWNNAAGGTGTLAALLDDAGLVTGVSVQWRGRGAYTGITEAPGNARMMRGYLAPLPGETVTVTVSGLDSVFHGGEYNLLVYFDGDNASAAWATRFTVGTTALAGTDLAGTNFGGTLVEDAGSGGNYVRFDGLTGNQFVLTAAGPASDPALAAVNGFQILHTPEPATLGLLAAGLAIFLARRRAR